MTLEYLEQNIYNLHPSIFTHCICWGEGVTVYNVASVWTLALATMITRVPQFGLMKAILWHWRVFANLMFKINRCPCLFYSRNLKHLFTSRLTWMVAFRNINSKLSVSNNEARWVAHLSWLWSRRGAVADGSLCLVYTVMVP